MPRVWHLIQYIFNRKKYCSSSCYRISSRTLIGFVYNCHICGKEFEKSYKDQQCCSFKCSTIKGANTKRIYPDSLHRLNQRRESEAIRRKIDPLFVLKNRMRSLMYSSLRGTKNGRKWQNLVGYSVEDLKKHLQKKFTKGMTWEKFLNGEIHIDHKIPVDVFNFTRPSDFDFKRCWDINNLQPLWAYDNLSKSNKIKRPFQPALNLRYRNQ